MRIRKRSTLTGRSLAARARLTRDLAILRCGTVTVALSCGASSYNELG